MLLLADGYIELKVVSVDGTDVCCRVVHGGTLDSHKGINLPRRSLDVPALTEKDNDDLRFGLAEGVDYVAASFVRSADDLLRIKAIMDQQGRRAPLIAKIEKHEALRSIVDILDNSEGLMVARGDLAVETPFERVPLVQKSLIERCNRAGKSVITATQMLRSMVENPRPTRAEAADVANAVLDGTDAVMLSEETAIGQYPIETVHTMDRIVRTAETRLASREHLPSEREAGHVTVPAAIGHVAVTLARDLNATAILTPTQTGGSARRVSRFRPSVPIVAISTPRNNDSSTSACLGCHSHSHSTRGRKHGRADRTDETGCRGAWHRSSGRHRGGGRGYSVRSGEVHEYDQNLDHRRALAPAAFSHPQQR